MGIPPCVINDDDDDDDESASHCHSSDATVTSRGRTYRWGVTQPAITRTRAATRLVEGRRANVTQVSSIAVLKRTYAAQNVVYTTHMAIRIQKNDELVELRLAITISYSLANLLAATSFENLWFLGSLSICMLRLKIFEQCSLLLCNKCDTVQKSIIIWSNPEVQRTSNLSISKNGIIISAVLKKPLQVSRTTTNE